MFSAVHPTTDIAKILRHVRFVPLATSQPKARLRQHPTSWHSRAGGGAVHSINLGQRRSTSVLKRKTPGRLCGGVVSLSYRTFHRRSVKRGANTCRAAIDLDVAGLFERLAVKREHINRLVSHRLGKQRLAGVAPGTALPPRAEFGLRRDGQFDT